MTTTVVTFHTVQECLLICDAVDRRYPPWEFMHIHSVTWCVICTKAAWFMNADGGNLLNIVGFDFDRPFSSLSPAKQTSPKQARRTVNITRHINCSSAQAFLSTETSVSLNRWSFHAEGVRLYMKRPGMHTTRWPDSSGIAVSVAVEWDVVGLDDPESWSFYTLAVTLRTTRFNIQKLYMVLTLRLCVVPRAKNKQRILALHNISRLVLYKRGEVITVRYALSPYIKQTCLVFEGLIWNCSGIFTGGKWEERRKTYVNIRSKIRHMLARYQTARLNRR